MPAASKTIPSVSVLTEVELPGLRWIRSTGWQNSMHGHLGDACHDPTSRLATLLEGNSGDVRVPLLVLGPKRQHLRVLSHLAEDMSPMRHPLGAAPFLACCRDGVLEGGWIAFLTPELPKHVDVVEVAGSGVGHSARDDGLQLLGEHCFQGVCHEAYGALVEEQRVPVLDGWA